METIIGAGPGNPGNANNGGPQAADWIKDGGTEQFGQDVIEASMTVPVIVDFWAPWCGPCKQLGPALEKAVQAARGAVRLVKIDVDKNKALAGQLRVQSIPAVFAFFQGQPVDGFVGAQSESEIKRFVERLLQQAGAGAGLSPVEQALEQAQTALSENQLGAASSLFGQVLQHEPENETALAGTIHCHLAAGDATAARQTVDALPADMIDKPAFASAKAALELAEQSADAGPVSDLSARVAQNPQDHQARFELALALHAAGQHEAAAAALLEIVRRDRAWNEEAARQQLLKFFEAWGPTDPQTVAARRQLSSMLFS